MFQRIFAYSLFRSARPLLVLIGWLVIAFVAYVACDIAAEEDHIRKDSVPWAAGPTDGVWPEPPDSSFRTVVPFGEASPDATFTYLIQSPPELKTADGGKKVLMTSEVKVTRVGGDSPDVPLRHYNSAYFRRGADDPKMSYNEASGTLVDVACQPETLNVGQSAICSVSTITSGVEIRNSYWVFGGYQMGTWPSQGEA